MNNQESREKSQMVNFSQGDENQVKQEVTFDPSDEGGWLVVSHSGTEISLSLENWRKLNELVESTVKETED